MPLAAISLSHSGKLCRHLRVVLRKATRESPATELQTTHFARIFAVISYTVDLPATCKKRET
jgi:hypothetical protein